MKIIKKSTVTKTYGIMFISAIKRIRNKLQQLQYVHNRHNAIVLSREIVNKFQQLQYVRNRHYEKYDSQLSLPPPNDHKAKMTYYQVQDNMQTL